jgi:imidazolonepropionase
MSLLIENAKQIVTCHTQGKRYTSGKDQSRIGLLENASIYCEDGVIKMMEFEIPSRIKESAQTIIDARDKVIMPGFVDSHTHLVFAGERSNEFSMRMKGISYEEIAKSGGGILSTVNATKNASKNELKETAKKRLATFTRFGVTTIEAKSGYGLDYETEIKILEVINELKSESPLDIFATYLGAHALPEDKTREEYINLMLDEVIPAVSERKLAKFIDVFCEMNYFTPEETELILTKGSQSGLTPKIHTNQFYSIGGIEAAVKCKAISADHLESMKPHDIKSLIQSDVIACLLPSVSYFLNIPYAPARDLIDNDVPVALATDFNPGSSMTENIQLVLSLAVQNMKISVEEAINGITINGAAALGISDRAGSIEEGKQADLLVFDMPDYSHIAYHFGVNQIEKVIKKGKVIYEA